MVQPLASFLRTAVAAASAALLLMAAAPVYADEAPGSAPEPLLQEPGFRERAAGGFAVGFDLVVVRSLSLFGVAAGACAFIPAAILTSPGGRPALGAAYEVFVETPVASTFRRPLGDF